MNAYTIALALSPDLAGLPAWSTYEQLARLQTTQCIFGSKYELAVALRALHMATLAVYRPSGESGAISSKREGDLAVGYSSPTGNSGSSGSLSATHWGQQLQDLMKGSTAAAGVTGVGGFCAEPLESDCGLV